jgi:hypothetical protein
MNFVSLLVVCCAVAGPTMFFTTADGSALAAAQSADTNNVNTDTNTDLVAAAETETEAEITASQALEAAKVSLVPDGVAFTGTVEQLDEPVAISPATAAAETDGASQTESTGAFHGPLEFHGRRHGYGGWGHGHGFGYGGYGGFGKHRFGFSCRGVPGWAYPLGYWNNFGAGLYGGGCGLGLAAGGLYYC